MTTHVHAVPSRARSRLRAEVDLPTPVAWWVLSAHAVALASPLALNWVAHRHAGGLGRWLDAPFLLHVAAALFFAGSAFEIAQNTVDRWYYEGPYVAFSDLLFNGCVAFGLGALALAASTQWWVLAVVVAGCLAFPLLYLADRVPYPATGVLGLLAVGLWLAAFDNGTILLLLAATTGLNLYLLALVVRTRAQSLHGGIALANGLGLLAVPWTIEGAIAGATLGVGTVLLATVLLAAVLAVSWPRLARLEPTPRPSRATGDQSP